MGHPAGLRARRIDGGYPPGIDGVLGVLALGATRVHFDFERGELGWSRLPLQQPFRIGERYVIEPSLNRVTGPRGVSRLEPKVMLVLVCLAEHAGEIRRGDATRSRRCLSESV